MLDYSDAFLVGLTATPSKQTIGFFNQNLVTEYNHERAVADGVNVGYDVYRIKTVQESARAQAQESARVSHTGQPSLLSSEELHDTNHYDSLRDRYLAKSRGLVLKCLQTRGRVSYDEVWALAMSQPLTWQADLKAAWVSEWRESVRGDGMKPGQRVPHLGESNILVWIATPPPPNGML